MIENLLESKEEISWQIVVIKTIMFKVFSMNKINNLHRAINSSNKIKMHEVEQ